MRKLVVLIGLLLLGSCVEWRTVAPVDGAPGKRCILKREGLWFLVWTPRNCEACIVERVDCEYP